MSSYDKNGWASINENLTYQNQTVSIFGTSDQFRKMRNEYSSGIASLNEENNQYNNTIRSNVQFGTHRIKFYPFNTDTLKNIQD